MKDGSDQIYGVEIDDAVEGVLTVSLVDLVATLDPWGSRCRWHILHLWATGRLEGDRSILEFEKSISSSRSGLEVSWDELVGLAGRFDQVIDAVFVGDESPRPVCRTADDLVLYRKHDLVIEAFDSTYWRVVSRWREPLDAVEKTYRSTRRCL